MALSEEESKIVGDWVGREIDCYEKIFESCVGRGMNVADAKMLSVCFMITGSANILMQGLRDLLAKVAKTGTGD